MVAAAGFWFFSRLETCRGMVLVRVLGAMLLCSTGFGWLRFDTVRLGLSEPGVDLFLDCIGGRIGLLDGTSWSRYQLVCWTCQLRAVCEWLSG